LTLRGRLVLAALSNKWIYGIVKNMAMNRVRKFIETLGRN